MITLPHTGQKAALIVAHPSHELRVYGWLERTRPLVFVLTDGGGRSREPRLPATRRVIDQAGSQVGPVFGWIGDLELYDAILRQDFGLFTNLAMTIAEALVKAEIDYVAGDAAEGYSSAHDLNRMIIDAAIVIAQRKYGREIANYDFLVIACPETYAPEEAASAFWIQLDEGEFSRKVMTAREYHPKLKADIEAALAGEQFMGIRRFSEPQIAGQIEVNITQMVINALQARPELNQKVSDILGGVSLDAFQVECLRPVEPFADQAVCDEDQPFYDLYGEKLVEAGKYQAVIRYREHLAPIREALRQYAHDGR